MLDKETAQEMLILAGLTYRGSLDPDVAKLTSLIANTADLAGERHDRVLAQGVKSGLDTLAPVHGKWELVWGPASSRADGHFDSSAMYVVRHTIDRHRYVVAVRGTNPVSLPDWLFGDLNVATTVLWPFDSDGAEVSTSTAFGLYSLLQLQSAPLGGDVGAVERRPGLLSAAVRQIDRISNPRLRVLFEPFELFLTKSLADLLADTRLPQRVGARLGSTVRILSDQLLPRTSSAASPATGMTLFEFLSQEANGNADPLDVTVTGHSKGGALAPALALWLLSTRTPHDDATPGWDRAGTATIRCVTFAGPTPGNTAFAKRIATAFEGTHHRVVNTNDVVTHAWQAKQLQEVPLLFGNRSGSLTKLFDAVASDVASLDYAHASEGVMTFPGKTDPRRSLVQELIHQHMDAYCEQFDLQQQGIDALTFFLG